MPRKKYTYQVNQIYRGYQVFTMCNASSYKEAAELMEVTIGYLRNYGYKMDLKDEYNEVMAYIDSGGLIFEEGRKDLIRKIIPYQELKLIIEDYNKRKYSRLGL